MQITFSTLSRASADRKFEEWVYFLQQSRLLQHCPRCAEPMRRHRPEKSLLSDRIWICEPCAASEEREWQYMKFPQIAYEQWQMYADYQVYGSSRYSKSS